MQKGAALAEDLYVRVLHATGDVQATVQRNARPSDEAAQAEKVREERDSRLKQADQLKQDLARDEVDIDAQQKVSAKRYAEVLKETKDADVVPPLPEHPDELRFRMEAIDPRGPEMRCGQSIPTRSSLTTRGVEIVAKSSFQGSSGGQYSWKYVVTFKNKGTETVQMLTRHWIFVDSEGTLDNEVKGPGARGVTPVLPPGGSWTYESGTSLPTSYGSMYGSFQFEVLKDASPGSARSFSARVGRLALSQDGSSRKVPCAPEKSNKLLPTTAVFSVERVIIGGNSRPMRKKGKKYTFVYDVQINNARADDIEVVGHHWEVVDAAGKRQTIADGPGVGGVYKSTSRPLSAGDAFRTQGELFSPTPDANAEGTYRVRIPSADSIDGMVEIEARTGLMGLASDPDQTHVENFVADPNFQ